MMFFARNCILSKVQGHRLLSCILGVVQQNMDDSEQHAKKNNVRLKYGEKIIYAGAEFESTLMKEKINCTTFLFSKLKYICIVEFNSDSKLCLTKDVYIHPVYLVYSCKG